ncbi:MAG: YigZ family protein [Anaerolineae bacterium]|nr:YigZ family protein [Anaerolineae bacterium]
MPPYPIPAEECRHEIEIQRSRFIAAAAPVFTVAEARAFIQRIRAEHAQASHNVPAFLVGFGPAVTAHYHDDGEPSGTAGRPVLTVLQGSGLGDIAVVVTRYFGGIKLGTGGLVRAYTEATQGVLAILPRAQKIPTHTIMLVYPYNYIERIRLLVVRHRGRIVEEHFAADVTLTAQFSTRQFPPFQDALRELSHGTLAAEIITTEEAIIRLPTPEE